MKSQFNSKPIFIILLLCGLITQTAAVKCLWEQLYEMFAASDAVVYDESPERKTEIIVNTKDIITIDLAEDDATCKKSVCTCPGNCDSQLQRTQKELHETLEDMHSKIENIHSTVTRAVSNEQQELRALKLDYNETSSSFLNKWTAFAAVAVMFLYVVWQFKKVASMCQRDTTDNKTNEVLDHILTQQLETEKHLEMRVDQLKNLLFPQPLDAIQDRQLHSKEYILSHLKMVADKIRQDPSMSPKRVCCVTPEFLEKLADYAFRDWAMNKDLDYITPEFLLSLASVSNGDFYQPMLLGELPTSNIDLNFRVTVHADPSVEES